MVDRFVFPMLIVEDGAIVAQAQSLTDYGENKIVDALFRGRALSAPLEVEAREG